MTIEIEVDTPDLQLGFDLVGATTLSAGMKIDAPGPAALEFRGADGHRAIDAQFILHFLLDKSADIAVGLFSAWLYEKLKGRATKLRIDRIEVPIDESSIRKVLAERFEGES